MIEFHFEEFVHCSDFWKLELFKLLRFGCLLDSLHTGADACTLIRSIERRSALDRALELGLEHFCRPLLFDTHEGNACQFMNSGSPIWNKSFITRSILQLACSLGIQTYS